jgi:hypothetical protein
MKILMTPNTLNPDISLLSFMTTELTVELAKQGHGLALHAKCRDCAYSEFLKDTKFKF